MRHWNKLDKLEKGLVKMWGKFPQNLEYPSELARLLMMQGQWEKAEKVLRTILGQWTNPKLEKCLLGFCLKMKNLQLNQGIEPVTYWRCIAPQNTVRTLIFFCVRESHKVFSKIRLKKS
jgi:hypothetical protein